MNDLVTKYGSRVHTRPGSKKPKKNAEIVMNDPTRDPQNFANRQEHTAALRNGPTSGWGTPIMRRAGMARKDRHAPKESCEIKELKKELTNAALQVVKRGLPRDPMEAARVTKFLESNNIRVSTLLELRRREAVKKTYSIT